MKDRVLVVSALLVLLVTNIAFAAPEWYAVQTDVLPTIDANFSDAVWTKAREYVIDRYIADDGGTLIELHSPIPHVNTGRFYLLWDSEYLCVYAKVTDQNVYTGAVRGEPTNGGTDVIQLCIEPLAWRAPTNTLAYIIDMTPGSGDDSGPLAWEHWQIQGNLDEVDIAAKATDSGYEIEAAIPWSLFDNIDVRVGAEIPFGMIILDASLDVHAYYLLMDYGQGENRIGCPEEWNTLNLIE